MGKVVDEIFLKENLPDRSRRIVVFTNGCFDLLHVGHIRYLTQAKQLGELLIVGINSDESVRKIKGPQRPIQPQSDRAEILAALGMVDFVIIFNEANPERIIELLRPDILVKGGDWPESQIVGADFVRSYGGVVQSLDWVEGKSTTRLLEPKFQKS